MIISQYLNLYLYSYLSSSRTREREEKLEKKKKKIKKIIKKRIIKITDMRYNHLSLLAYLSLSMSSSTSPTFTGPLTFLIRCLFSAYLPVISVTLTWVIPPLDPVLPSKLVTLALTGSESINYCWQIFIKILY